MLQVLIGLEATRLIAVNRPGSEHGAWQRAADEVGRRGTRRKGVDERSGVLEERQETGEKHVS